MREPIRRATIIVNSSARGVARRFDPGAALRLLRSNGVEARLEAPDSPANTLSTARAAAERGDDMVFAVGGDGTLRLAAVGVANTSTALAAVPSGTVNVWAREVGIPRGSGPAIESHLAGQVVAVDLGRADAEAFLLMAGIGWDARVVARVGARAKRWLGDKAYMAQGAWMAPRLRTVDAHWKADGDEHEGQLALLIVSNTRLYGGRVEFTPEALANDGLLDLCALRPRGPRDTIRLSAGLLRRRLESDPRALTARVHEVEVTTAGIPYQLDGDLVGQTPARFSVEAGALSMSIPAGLLPPVLGGAVTRPRSG
jgi:YegS/Rv2252/BmrU family lipid kinase